MSEELLEAEVFLAGQAVGVAGEPGGGLVHGRSFGKAAQRRVGSAQGLQSAAHAAGAAKVCLDPPNEPRPAPVEAARPDLTRPT